MFVSDPSRLADQMRDRPSGGSPPRGVLVADDDESVRQLLTDTLRDWGYAVWEAEDGFAAVALFHQIEDELDLVILDVRMPRLDGPHALAAIRESGSRVPCCFISGDIGSYSEARLATLSGQPVLGKPFRPADLANAISHLRCDAAVEGRER